MAVCSRAMERLEPTLSGWLGVAEPFDFELPVPQPVHASALRYQMSAPPLPAAAGITAALEVLELAGIDAISEAVLARSAAVEEAGRRVRRRGVGTVALGQRAVGCGQPADARRDA